jgi:hypothetical protein
MCLVGFLTGYAQWQETPEPHTRVNLNHELYSMRPSVKTASVPGPQSQVHITNSSLLYDISKAELLYGPRKEKNDIFSCLKVAFFFFGIYVVLDSWLENSGLV